MLFKEQPQHAVVKDTISLEDQVKRKCRKNRSEEKVVDFRSDSLFPARKREAVIQGGTTGIDHSMWRRAHGAGTVKGWEDKRDRAHSRYIHVK